MPAVTLFGEIFFQQFRRHTALNFKSRVPALAAAFEHLFRNIRADQFDLPTVKLATRFKQQHGKRIRLLTAGTGRTPDTDALGRLIGFDHRGQDHLRETLKGPTVAEKQCFVRRHCFDDFESKPFLDAETHLRDEVGQRFVFQPARDRRKATFEQIALVRRQREARALVEKLSQKFKIFALHSGSPLATRPIA